MSTPYDKQQVVDQYDSHYAGRIERVENERIQALLLPLAVSAVVLDLGAGTGLVKALTDPDTYVAADRSGPMLTRLTEQHPGTFTIRADLNRPSGIRHLINEARFLGPFDLITCIFSGHFIHAPTLFEAAFELLGPGGTVVHHGNMPRRRHRKAGLYAEWADLEIHPDYRTGTLRDSLTAAGFEDVDVLGMNAVPDWITKALPDRLSLRLMTASRHIPARWHFHVAGIGRKPYE